MEHKNIPNDGLHEPKDIVFATAGQVYVADGAGSGNWSQPPIPGVQSALEGQVYVANGAGGGTWAYLPGGWAVYDDTGATFTANTTPTDLPIDGLGPDTNEGQIPQSAPGPLWSGTELNPVALGDVYYVELSFEVVAAPGATMLTLSFGGESTSYQAQPGLYKFTVPMFIAEGPASIEVSVDSGTADITARKVKVVQVYGA